MEFCAEWDGGSGLHCDTFDGSLLPPDCSRPPDDDVPDDDGTWSCNDFLTEPDCMVHQNDCDWTNGVCNDRP
jgi:hypothetical protein